MPFLFDSQAGSYCFFIHDSGCNLTQFIAERGLNVSEVKTGDGMRQYFDQGLALFYGHPIHLSR